MESVRERGGTDRLQDLPLQVREVRRLREQHQVHPAPSQDGAWRRLQRPDHH